MSLVLKILRNLSEYHRTRFFYRQENLNFQKDLDALRARAAFLHLD